MDKQPDPVTILTHGGGADQWGPIVRERCPGVEIIDGSRWRDVRNELQRVTCLAGWRFPPQLFESLPNLKWIQSVSVGVDDWVDTPSIASDVVVTNTKGLYADSVAEYVMWALLTLSRRFQLAIANQAKRRWRQFSGVGLAGRVLGVAGMGHIGRAIASRARAFGMRTIGIVRDPAGASASSDVDEIRGIGEIEALMAEMDALVLSLPLTEQTRGIVREEAIREMRRGSIIVNISRQEIIDYRGIADALKSGRLAGAALDVFEREPLSRWDHLWRVDNLIVTPHLSALTLDYKTRVADLICENMRRFTAGERLLGLVDRAKGY